MSLRSITRLSRSSGSLFRSGFSTQTKEIKISPEKKCREIVQRRDYEHYITGLLYPTNESRRSLYAIRALNAEVAAIKDVVSQPAFGSIRIQWWKEAVLEVFTIFKKQQKQQEKPSIPNPAFDIINLAQQNNSKQQSNNNQTQQTQPQQPQQSQQSQQTKVQQQQERLELSFGEAASTNPILLEISRAIQANNLSRTWFIKMFDRRLSDVEGQKFIQIEDLEKYAEETASSLLYLSLECLGIKDVNFDHAASHLGKAIGICTLLKGTPYHIKKRTLYLPLSLLAKKGITEEQIYRGEFPSDVLAEVIFDIAKNAKSHLDHAKKLSESLPYPASAAFVPMIFVENFLNQLENARFDIFDTAINRRPLSLYWKLLKIQWKVKYLKK